MAGGMPGDADPMGWRDCAAVAALLAFALMASGCSGGGSMFGGPATSTATTPPASSGGGWLPDSVTNFFSGATDKGPQPVAGATADVECPYIQIREGASTLTISAGGDSSAMALKYQGTFVRAARQCAVVAGQMVMKVGVQGRIILGPQGGPGQVNVPLRIAVVDDKPSSMKTILTRLIIIPVTVGSADDNPTFTHVEDNLTFPLPSSSDLADYIVYIGFDPLAAEQGHKPVKPRRKIKRTVKPEAARGTD
jgi:hypothetical protein